MSTEALAAVEKMLQKSIAITAGTGIGNDIMVFLTNRALPVGVHPHVKLEEEATPPPPPPSQNNAVALVGSAGHPDDGGQGPSNVVGESSATLGLFDLVKNAVAELQGKEEALQASKSEVVQLKLEIRLLKEAHAKELETVNAAHSAEVARLSEELRRASATHEAELQAVKVHDSNMKRQIISLLTEDEADVLAPSPTGGPPGSAAPQARRGSLTIVPGSLGS